MVQARRLRLRLVWRTQRFFTLRPMRRRSSVNVTVAASESLYAIEPDAPALIFPTSPESPGAAVSGPEAGGVPPPPPPPPPAGGVTMLCVSQSEATVSRPS